MLLPSFRGFARLLLPVCIALAAATSTVAQSSTAVAGDGYDPNVEGNVYAAVAQRSDGKVIIVGSFTSVSPNGGAKVTCSNIARLNHDGTVDSTFYAETNGPIRTVALDRTGKVLIGGEFTNVNGVARNRLARLNQDGTLDAAFAAGVSTSTTLPVKPEVLALLVQDDKIIVGGTFGSAISTSGATTVRNNLVRFTATGAVDSDYDPNPNGMVLTLAAQADGKLIVGGAFTQFVRGTTTTARQRAARLNTDGTVDAQFDPQPNNGVSSVAVQRDGKILLGGYFTTVKPNGGDTATRNHLARFNSNGTLDTDFVSAIGGNVNTIAIAPDGGILVGGRFTQVWGRGQVAAVRPYVVRFADDGTTDTSFNPGLNYDVTAIVVQPDGKVVLGGYFTRAQSPGLNAPVVRNHVARVLTSGALDTTFQIDEGGRILASVTDRSTGKITVAGSFTNVGGQVRYYVARLDANGVLDSAFKPELNGAVYAMSLYTADDANKGKLLIGGAFTTIGGETRNHIARLNADGSLDTTFSPGLDGLVGSIALQSDGKILVGGLFNSVTPTGTTTSTARQNLLRLTSTGTLDETFKPIPNGAVSSILVLPDSKILVGGSFTLIESGSQYGYRYRLARLNTDGSLDLGYDVKFNDAVSTIAREADGSILVGGRFGTAAGNGSMEEVVRKYLARVKPDGTLDSAFNPAPNGIVLALAVQEDKKILVGGAFTGFQPNGATDVTTTRYVARLNTDGTLDTNFNLQPNERVGDRVDSISVQPSGDILVGGTFVTLMPKGSTSPVQRNHFARIKQTGELDTAFDVAVAGSATAIVKAVSLQPDGKILVGGKFSSVAGSSSSNIARFSQEGHPDASFNLTLSTDGDGVNALAVRAHSNVTPTPLGSFAWLNNDGSLRTAPAFQPDISISGKVNAIGVDGTDGSVIIAGNFADASGKTKGNIARLSTTGKAVTSFVFTVTGTIYDLAVEPDGDVIIVGAFTQVNSTTRNNVARLKKDGTLDTFDPNVNGEVMAVALQSDGAVILGGAFTTLTPNATTTAVTRNYLARVTSTGTLDTAFNPNLNGTVNSLAIDSTGRVIAGGAFTTVQPNNATTSTARNRIARFLTTGEVDTTFDPDVNAVVTAIVIDPTDQNIVIGGGFTTVKGATRTGIARLKPDGTENTAFTALTNNTVYSISMAPNGDLLVAGTFSTVTPTGSSAPVSRNQYARFTRTGALDINFNPDFSGQVLETNVVASDGSLLVGGIFSSMNPVGVILVGGSFNNIAGLPYKNLAQLNGNGSVNAGFQPNPNGAVNALAVLPEGSFYVGGAFTQISGTARAGVARYGADAQIDSSFTPVASIGNVRSLAVQSDGKLLVGSGSSPGLLRLNTDGSVDGTFTSGASFAPATAIAIQSDGKIFVAGTGSGVGSRIYRLNTDGTVDTSFATVLFPDASVSTLTLQADGSLIVAGSFISIKDTAIRYVARVKSDGAVDSAFNPGANGAVTAVALQPDGRLVIGGEFTKVGELLRPSIARVSTNLAALQTLGVSADGKTVTWLRGGSASELSGVNFERSSDALSWTSLGTGTRIAGTSNWQITDLSLPTNATIYVRARGIAPTTAGTSSGTYESISQINLSSSNPGLASIVAPLVTSLPWDQSHYVWTLDAAGILRIADRFSLATLDTGKTVLIGDPADRPPVSAAAGGLADISTRATVTPNDPLIGGFAIAGTTSRSVLIRAVGPGLAPFGVSNHLRTPQMIVYNSAGNVLARVSGWNSSLSADFVRTGAFPLEPGSADCALLMNLAPGSYTVQVADGSSSGSAGGDTLVEVYDAGDLNDRSARLVNLSSRGTIPANGSLIGGLVVSGNVAKTLLVRGVGPTLTNFGVSGTVADPIITVYDAEGRVIVSNDNWQVSNQPTIPELDFGAAMRSAATAAGAFQLNSGSKDAALVITVQSGAYTVQVSSANGSSGAAMIEFYELP